MKWIDAILKGILAIFGVIFLHVLFVYWMPYPLNYTHMILASTVLIIFMYEHGSIVWLSLIWYLILEYLSATPFGMILLSGVVATFVMYIAYKEVLTNRSLVSSVILLSTGYVVYRFIYITLYIFWAIYAPAVDMSFLFSMKLYLLEWFITCSILVVLFTILRHISRELKRQQIEESWFKHLGS